MNKRPVIVHLIYQLDIGGLERVMLNCISNMQAEKNYQHVIISLTDANQFSQDALHEPVDVYCLNKRPGSDLSVHGKLFKLLRKIKPNILHTYNLATIEYHPIARLAGVKGHIHAEHGRDINDPEGKNKKHNLLRRLMSPFLHYYIAVSENLFHWLKDEVNIPGSKVKLIHNGINTNKFNLPKVPATQLRLSIIARLSPIKDHANLIDGFNVLKQDLGIDALPQLNIIGDGPLKTELEAKVSKYQLANNIKFLGARDDIAQLLSQTDVFVLSSIAEGIPMTILEAMSSSTPIIATAVGGIPEVVTDGVEGQLVEKQNSTALAEAIKLYIAQPERIQSQGVAARQRVVEEFSEESMVEQYSKCYDLISR
ncbi:TIGR03088 family PEP-CTERM/XrtA system glycosyltransferase [Thalassotalea fusca]